MNCWSKVGKMGVLFLLLAGAAHAADDDEPNNGEDFTRPITRFDMRYRFQESSGGVDKDYLILRRDVTFQINENWKFATRVDVPLLWSDAASSGHTDFGLGDILLQAGIVESVNDRFAWGGGGRVTFPTATESLFGTGKYLLSPIAGARWKLPEISKGSFFEFIARYDADIGGDEDRSHISRLRMAPELNVALPDKWYVTLFPSQDVAVDFLKGDKWFVPADFLIGHHLTDRIVAGIEVSIPVIKQFDLYAFKVEARVSFHF
jgi:hypothetical protein